MQRPGMGHVIAAYAIIAAAILGYLRSLWLRQRSLQRQIQALLDRVV
jgi:hypothetical protein